MGDHESREQPDGHAERGEAELLAVVEGEHHEQEHDDGRRDAEEDEF